MNTDGIPGWAKGLAVVIAALIPLVGALAALGVDFSADDKTQVVQQQVPIPAGVQPDADQQKEPDEQVVSGARPVEQGSPLASPNLANAGIEIEEDMVDETPPGISQEEALEAHVTPPNPLPEGQEYKPLPQGGANEFTCRQNYVRNYSPRSTGVRVSMFVLHITVSSPGSLRAIWNLFNTPAFGASSTYLLELNKQCEQIVPWASKPWTQGAFNSSSESVEIVTNLLTRNEWLASPIIRDAMLAKLVVSRLKARGLPARLVDPVGCTPQAGYTDHERLECGNNHVDVGTGFPWDKFKVQVTQIYEHGTVCDERCKRAKRQQRVVQGRKRKHQATHVTYREEGCRAHPHKTRPREYRRQRCRELKLRIKEQHAGIRRATATLEELR